MKKILVLTLALIVSLTPLSFAGVCTAVDSQDYLESTGAKFVRGIGNAALSWVELFRQPALQANK